MLYSIFAHQWKDIFLAIYVHFLLTFAVFDIFYRSPLVPSSAQNFQSKPNFEFYQKNPLADRLVIFVADGLRADTFYHKDTVAPFLKNKRFAGSWGVSHSRMPTESRPGHVAMLAGFYEDISAVTKGWSRNAAEFDSVFNRSRYSWAWGSPDIVPMFTEGVNDNRMTGYSYSSSIQDFASENSSYLDEWVFRHVEEFFSVAPKNAGLFSSLKENKNIFFLHLLATDILGHGFKPKSQLYIDNVNLVDAGIERIFNTVEKFYEFDQRTAYMFLSDHGMTDWGSHGAGDRAETETPFIFWGSGLQRTSFTLPDVRLWQIDTAPLISAILGLQMPANSLGTMPIRFLNGTDQLKASAMCANFEAISGQMSAKRNEKMRTSYKRFFKEYPQLSAIKLDLIKNQIDKLFAQRRFTLAASVCAEWIRPSVDALMFYHRYERNWLLCFIVMTYLTWTVYILCKHCAKLSIDYHHSKITIWMTSFLSLCMLFYLYTTSQPIRYYVYCFTPIYLLYNMCNIIFTNWNNVTVCCYSILRSIMILVCIELYVICFNDRRMLSLILVTSSIVYYCTSWNEEKHRRYTVLLVLILNSIFPMLPTIGLNSSNWLITVACGWAVQKVLYDLKPKLVWLNANLSIDYQYAVLATLFIAYMIRLIINLIPSSTVLNMLSWGLLLSCLGLMIFSSRKLSIDFPTVYLTLFPVYVLMSTYYEPLFYLSFCFMLDIILVQAKPFLNSLAQRCLITVFFVLLAFFGTGNLASLNSFDPNFVKPFITVFSPFLMTSLLLLKVCMPIVLVSFSLVINEHGKKQIDNVNDQKSEMFWTILAISDLMALNMFFQLKEEGSWLDIGSSISQFIICSALSVVVILGQILAEFLVIKRKISGVNILAKKDDGEGKSMIRNLL